MKAIPALKIDAVFAACMVALFVLFAGLFAHNPSGHQLGIFFGGTNDFFADFFNVASMSAHKNPYWYGMPDPAPQEHAYPPLNYLVFYFFSRFAPYKTASAFEAGFTTTGLVTAFAFVTLMALITLALLIYAYNKRGGVVQFLLPHCLLTSSIFIFSLERANSILLAAACVLFFIVAYRSKSKVVFELALISLAVATALKGYPALFGMLLLFDREFFASARCALYTLALVFLPFCFVVGGFECIPIWLHNIGLNSAMYGANRPSFGFKLIAFLINPNDAAQSPLCGILVILCRATCILGLFACVFLKSHWKRVLLLGLIVVCFQTNSAEYLGLYLFAGIILFFSEKEHATTDWIMLVLFILLLNPLQIVVNTGSGAINITLTLMGLSADIMLIWLTTTAIANAIPAIKRRLSPEEASDLVEASFLEN